MESIKETFTVGDLRKALAEFNHQDEVTFGSTTFTARPLIFFRTKVRGEKLIQIELNELDESHEEPEHANRLTVEQLLSHLENLSDDWEVTFGSSMDASSLSFGSVTQTASINLVQLRRSNWRVANSE
jgi:hypothetical protein